jgi:preprotein translocase subunit SecA
MEILPEAAVVKETARRLKDNSRITVTTAADREFSATKPLHLLLIHNNLAQQMECCSKEITWDMIHYDVQLIGGMVLHEGKVAEDANR